MPDDVPWIEGGPTARRRVTPEQAVRLGPVFAAGRLLSGTIASLPLQQYRRAGDVRQKMPIGSLFRQPSVVGTAHDWVFRAVESLVRRGNVVGLVTARDYYEWPVNVEWLHPDRVCVQDTAPYGPGSYIHPIWYVDGRVVPAEDIVHVPWYPVAGRVWGLSPMEAYAATVATGLGAQDYAADWFKNGGVPPGTFKNEEHIVPPDDADVIKRRLTAAIRTHEPIVYGKDWDYKPIAINPNEARFIETMRLTASQIAAIYGVPPEMVGGDTGGSMTYANVEQNSLNFVQFTLLPWLTKLETAFSALLPQPQYVKFNVDALIRSDIATRWAVYQTARQIGAMSVDEIRAREELPPLANGQGQDYTPLQSSGLAGNAVADVPGLRELPENVRPLRDVWVPGDEQRA